MWYCLVLVHIYFVAWKEIRYKHLPVNLTLFIKENFIVVIDVKYFEHFY